MMRLWFPLAWAGLAVTPLAAPLLAGSHPLAALVIRSFFSSLCHQDPARSFAVARSPVAVCVRCLGIYFGAGLAPFLRPGRALAMRLLGVALGLNLCDVVAEALRWHGSLPVSRFLLGLLLGLGAGAVLFLPREPLAVPLRTDF